MKRTLYMLLLLLVIGTLSGCARGVQETHLDTPGPTLAARDTPNPVVTYADFQALCAAVPDIPLTDAPADAQDACYTVITENGAPPVVQMTFAMGGASYIYRAAGEGEDVIGLRPEWTDSEERSVCADESRGAYRLFYRAGAPEGLASWSGARCRYTLYSENACDDARFAYAVLLMRFLPEELTQASGAVVSAQDGKLLLDAGKGTRIVIDMQSYAGAAVLPGDAVTIDCAGVLTDEPTAVRITVTKANEAIVSGVILQANSDGIFVQTLEDDVYGFAVDGETEVAGSDVPPDWGDVVHVVYSGELTDAPRAVLINVLSHATQTPSPAPNERTTEQKTLAGTVTAITAKGFKLSPDNEKNYTFALSKETDIFGRYTFAVSSRVIVTYHGLASRKPVAESIQVITPAITPSPLPSAAPTPKPASEETFSGTVVSFQENRITVKRGEEEMEFHTLDATFHYIYDSGENVPDGKLAVGDRVQVNYFELSGRKYASYIEIVKPVPTQYPTGELAGIVTGTDGADIIWAVDVTDTTRELAFDLSKMTGEITILNPNDKEPRKRIDSGDEIHIWYQIIGETYYAVKVDVTLMT